MIPLDLDTGVKNKMQYKKALLGKVSYPCTFCANLLKLAAMFKFLTIFKKSDMVAILF